MSSVTQRIREIKQPWGGYIRPSQFELCKINDGRILAETENVHASIVGTAVDYLTRFAMGAKSSDAFQISCTGAAIAEKMFMQKNTMKTAANLLSGITAINKKSITNACKLVTYDLWLRNPIGAMAVKAKGADKIKPDARTIQNVKIMVQRSLEFWETYGPIVKDGFTFEPNGYTKTVDSGDGDYLTADTLWDFKVLKSKPTNIHTLQLLMYWIMGQHSGQKVYNDIQYLGIFNPRLNEVYLLHINSIPKETISEVERNVICY